MKIKYTKQMDSISVALLIPTGTCVNMFLNANTS